MSDPYVGEIRIFAGNFAPQGWNLCDGSLLIISENETLFALIGTTYGGDGQSTFAVPDLRGRLPVGQGTGTGLTPRSLGMQFGEEAHTLINAEFPTHNHAAAVTAKAATTTAAGPTVCYGTIAQPNNALGVYALYTTLVPPAVKSAPLQATAIASAGSSMPHNNVMRSTTLNFIISLYGNYPSQS